MLHLASSSPYAVVTWRRLKVTRSQRGIPKSWLDEVCSILRKSLHLSQLIGAVFLPIMDKGIALSLIGITMSFDPKGSPSPCLRRNLHSPDKGFVLSLSPCSCPWLKAAGIANALSSALALCFRSHCGVFDLAAVVPLFHHGSRRANGRNRCVEI